MKRKINPITDRVVIYINESINLVPRDHLEYKSPANEPELRIPVEFLVTSSGKMFVGDLFIKNAAQFELEISNPTVRGDWIINTLVTSFYLRGYEEPGPILIGLPYSNKMPGAGESPTNLIFVEETVFQINTTSQFVGDGNYRYTIDDAHGLTVKLPVELTVRSWLKEDTRIIKGAIFVDALPISSLDGCQVSTQFATSITKAFMEKLDGLGSHNVVHIAVGLKLEERPAADSPEDACWDHRQTYELIALLAEQLAKVDPKDFLKTEDSKIAYEALGKLCCHAALS